MKHPGLLRQASVKARVHLLMLMYDAFCYYEKPVSENQLWNVYQEFIHTDDGPQFIEDYALEVLAGHADRIRDTRDIIPQRKKIR